MRQKHKKHHLKRWALRASMSVRALALVSELPDAKPSHPSFLRNHLFIWKKQRFAIASLKKHLRANSFVIALGLAEYEDKVF